LIETAGGLCSPISHDADNLQMLNAIEPDYVVLVADAGLGTINAIRLCMKALSGVKLSGVKVIVYLNRFDTNDTVHASNRRWLAEHYQIETTISVEQCWQQIGAMTS